jgi:hypothetical protein
VDDPFAVQFYLNTMRPLAYGATRQTTGFFDQDRDAIYDYDAAADLLKSDAAVFLVVCHVAQMRHTGAEFTELASEPLATHGLHLLSNRPRLEQTDHMIMGVGPLRIETWDLRYIHAAAADFTFVPLRSSAAVGPGRVRISNGGSELCRVQVRLERNGASVTLEHLLQPGESWQGE